MPVKNTIGIVDVAVFAAIAGEVSIDECRRNAEQCLRSADEPTNDAQREALLEIARLWTQVELSSAEPNGVDGAAQSQGFQSRQPVEVLASA